MKNLAFIFFLFSSGFAFADTICPQVIHSVYEGTSDNGIPCKLTYQSEDEACAPGLPADIEEGVIADSWLDNNPLKTYFLGLFYEKYAPVGVCDFQMQKTEAQQIYRMQGYSELGAYADQLTIKLNSDGVPQSYVFNEAKAFLGGTNFGTPQRACLALKNGKTKNYSCNGLKLKTD